MAKKFIKVDSLITKCEETKKEISSDVQKIKKQYFSQKFDWKQISKNLSDHSFPKNSNFQTVSEEIHQKIREIYRTQINEKALRMSKFLVYRKNEAINDSDLANQEIIKFFSNNRREFGSPLKEISYHFSKRKPKVKSFSGTVNPEETILQDIQTIMMKNSRNYPLKKQNNSFEACQTEPCEFHIKDLSLKNQIALKEMKKLKPIPNVNFGVRKKEFLKNLHEKLSKSTMLIKKNNF
jgi:hypothetical protein